MNVKPPTTKLGDRLRRHRQTSQITQAALAEMLGVTQATLSRYETGYDTPGIPVARRIAAALKIPLDSLYVEGESALPKKKSRTKSP